MLVTFIVVQLINVIVSTIKYIVTIKSGPAVAAIANAISYTISAVITYFIAKQDILAVIIITFASNLIGVPIGKFIVDKLSKDRLWIYNATINSSDNQAFDLKHEFKDKEIDCIYEPIIDNKRYSFRIFSYNKDDSRFIKEMISKFDGKYYITEPR